MLRDRERVLVLSWHVPGDKWLALATMHCRGAFNCLLLPADVSLNATAKKPKLEAGAGLEEWNGGRGGINRTSVVEILLPSLSSKQCFTLNS